MSAFSTTTTTTSSVASPSNFIDLKEWKTLAEILKKGAHPGLTVLFYTSANCGFCTAMDAEFRPLAEKHPEVYFVRLDVNVPGRGSMFGVPGTMMGKKLEGTPSFFLYKDTQFVATVVGAGNSKMDELRSLISAHKSTGDSQEPSSEPLAAASATTVAAAELAP